MSKEISGFATCLHTQNHLMKEIEQKRKKQRGKHQEVMGAAEPRRVQGKPFDRFRHCCVAGCSILG